MAKSTKKRAIIYSNVKENKKLAEEKQKIKDSQINLNDEVIIGFNSNKNEKKQKNDKKSFKKNTDNNYKKSPVQTIKQQNNKKNQVNTVKQKNNKKNVNVKRNVQATKEKNPYQTVKVKNVKQNQASVQKKKKNPAVAKKIRNNVLKVVIPIVILAGIAIFMLNAKIFNIDEIAVVIENNYVLTESDIKDSSQIVIGQNLFSIDKRKAIDGIKKNHYVESVKIRKKIPNKITIEIVERKIKFQFESQNEQIEYIYIDENGVIVDCSTEKKDCICIKGYKSENLDLGNKVNEYDLEGLSAVMLILQEADIYGINNKITKIDISNHDDYLIYFDEVGKMAHLGNTSLISDKMARIQQILNKESDYEGEIHVNVDLNNGKYPYFRENV